MSDIIYIDSCKLKAFMKDAFIALGLPAEDAEISAEVLITADKRGIESHGVGKFKATYYDRIREGILNPTTRIDIVKETGTTAVIDGNNGMGHVIAKRAMEMAIEKAREHGLGMVAARNSNHYGIAGYYSLMATAENMVGMTGTNTRPSTAPIFGVENMLGTNPLAIGIPTDEEFDFLIDCATTVAPRGKIENYDRQHRDIPEGWAIDERGMPLVDTKEVLSGLESGKASLVPVGGVEDEDSRGYKGYGYATAVELLSAALQNGKFLKALSGLDADGNKIPFGIGHFFIAINVESFIQPELFRNIAGDILRSLRASKKMPGKDRIYTSGEIEHMKSLEREKTGIPINEEIQKQMIAIRDELGLDYAFEFDNKVQSR